MVRTLLRESFFFAAGIAFLALAKIKFLVRGYTTPKPYALDEIDRCIEYDVHIANRFLAHLARYSQSDVVGKRVLELGPGSDMGVGLLMVAHGASSYVGFDRHDLASSVPADFYERMAGREHNGHVVDIAALSDGRATYIVRSDFDVVAGVQPPVDIVFSNAAFEHFEDVDETVAGVTRVAAGNATLIVEIDMQTHSRWIREVDPNNIYRYPTWLYEFFSFPGQPNRLRPKQYRQALERHGWTEIEWWPENVVDASMQNRRLDRQFRGQNTDWLSFVICAKKSGIEQRGSG